MPARASSRLFIVCAILLWVLLDPASGQQVSERLQQLIDREVELQHAEQGQEFERRCSDEVFLRRVYLDLIGTVPTPDEARTFLNSDFEQKRSELIDDLIDRPEFGLHFADIWAPELTHPDLAWSPIPFVNWLGEQVNTNRSWDSVARTLLTATGPQHGNPAVTVFMSSNKAKTMRPEDVTNVVGRALMGIKLECAQCHDHPFIKCSHRQYWGIASFLGNTELRSNFPQYGDGPHRSEWETAGTIFGVRNSSQPTELQNPLERSLQLRPTYPDGRVANVAPYEAREAFATWLCDSKYPYLSRSFVNRTWHQLFGCGLVSPVDDHRRDNPPLYAKLRGKVVSEFRSNGYDIKSLYRAICNSATYQQCSLTHEDPRSLSGTNLRTVSSAQMFDILRSILGDAAVENSRGIVGARGSRKRFVERFGDDSAKGVPTRFSKATPDFLQLLNSHQLEKGIGDCVQRFRHLWDRPAEMIEELYLLTLSRYPRDDETERMNEYVMKSLIVEDGYKDVLWVLLNSGEFFFVP